MGDVVNLRSVRKAGVRKEAAQKATENAVKFGLSKAERARQAAQAENAARQLDGKRLE